MVGIFAHDGGAFKPVSAVPVNNSGTWQNAQEVWAKENGIWTKVFPSEVREPPTGEFYNQDTYNWRNIGSPSNSALITWNSDYTNAPFNSVSFTSGSWTYYRGTYRANISIAALYGIYRIGTP